MALRTIAKEELAIILEKHVKWLRGEDGGERADLTSANLRSANLTSADLTSANLRSANLRSADLTSANLTSAVNAELVIARTRTVPPEGSVIGWKKCTGGVLVKIKVPEEAKRSNAFGRKCRAEFVDVLEVIPAEAIGISIHDGNTQYEVGKRVACNVWDDDYRNECAGGIHFYITKEEALAHS